jgi:hypothetical protein
MFLTLSVFTSRRSCLQIITLNRRRILKEVAEVGGLAIHSEGMQRNHHGRYTAWISLEIPLAGNIHRTVTEMVFGKEKISQEAAKEEAASEAIKKILATGTIVIDDISYGSLRVRLN